MASPHFVLLHSPLLGASVWRPVADELARRGHDVATPAWPPLSEITSHYYQSLVSGLAAQLSDDGARLLVAAHSGAGALMPRLAAQIPHKLAAIIFVDAILPHPGRSWFDTAPAEMRKSLRSGALLGELPAWDAWWPPGALDRLVPDPKMRKALTSELEPLPVAYFEEAAPQDVYDGPAAYLRLSAAYDDECEVSARYGWPLVRLPLHHLAMLTHPETVAATLDSLGQRVLESVDG